MECSCCASLSRRANDILKALSGKTKPVYADRIPETLTPEHFNLHETFRHGFPSQPMCLAYDSVQQLLAIGTEDGAVLLLGKPGLEKRFSHPLEVCILQMTFITNKGRLVTSCDNKTLYLWSLEGKSPRVVHQMEFRIEIPTSISWMHGSEWMYVGTDSSNVYVVQVETFKLCGYLIPWKDTTDVGQLDKPGDVIAVQENPMDQGKVVIAFSCGMCALWDLKKRITDGRFFYNNQENIMCLPVLEKKSGKNLLVGSSKKIVSSWMVLTSMCWLGNGKSFACSYNDGCIAVWNPKKPGNKPEKTFLPHESDHAPTACKPIHKLQYINTDSGPWYICSEGFREDSPKSLIIKECKSSSVFPTAFPILDFLYLPSSPLPHDCQKPFALVVLTKNELIVHDLQTSGYPSFNLPYALGVHLPPVTCVQYCGNCPEEFIASLHSVKSKQMAEHKSTKPWPLMGGRWGEEAPHVSTDLIVTGHTDGSVRLWVCSSVIVQPLYSMSTSWYFKARQNGFVPQLETLMEEEDLGVVLGQGNEERESLQSLKRSQESPSMKPSAGRRVMNYLKNVATRTSSSSTPTHSEVEGSAFTPSLDENNTYEGTPTASPEKFVFAPSGNEYYFAIEEVHLCVNGLWMCAANMGGCVMAFDFKMGEVATTPKSLDICFNYDSILNPEGIPSSTPCAFTKPFDDWVLREGIRDSLPGFNLVQHCQCYYGSCNAGSEGESTPAVISSMQYSSEIGMLAIGTDQGFAVVDTITSRCLYTLSNLTSILYMTNPSGHGRRVSSPATFAVTSPKPTIQRHPTVRTISTQYIKVMTPTTTTPSSARQFVLPEPKRDSSVLEEKVEESECSVSALEVVQLQLDLNAPPTLTLWVGLASGHVAAYDITVTWPENVGFGPPQRILRLKLIPIRFLADRKSPIVTMHFLNEWGDLQVVPYKPLTLRREGGRRRSAETTQSRSPLHYVIITDENKIQSFSFPGFVPVSKSTSSDKDNILLQSEFFTCNDLPCLLTLTSFEQILVHSLPGLKPLLKVPFPFLGDSRVLRTFRVSGNGQVMFMSSASMIQRMSLAKDDRLNFPACLPDMYVQMTEPQCIRGRETPTAINREQIFSTGRRRIGVVTRPSLHPPLHPPLHSTLHPPGVSGQFSDMRRAADRRGRKLTDSLAASGEMARRAREFSASVHHTS